MVEKVLQSHIEKQIFWSLVAVLFALTAFYIWCVHATIAHVVARQTAEREASALTLDLSTKEFQYISQTNAVTLDMAHSLGFQDVEPNVFVSRNPLPSLALATR